jgi:S1-C subfamily serine protease
MLRVAPGDVIVGMAGQPVRDVNAMRQLQAALNANVPVQAQVLRQGQMYDLTLNGPSNR